MSKRNLVAYAKGNNLSGLSHSETVVVLLLRKYPDNQIPEKTVIDYYRKRVKRNELKDNYGVWKPYTTREGFFFFYQRDEEVRPDKNYFEIVDFIRSLGYSA